MTEYKILVTGAMGAGKTTAICAVSDFEPLKTDVANSDGSVSKPSTTVGLDLGILTLDTGDRIRLFGTPGQVRFDFLWRILVRNALGLIILVDNSRPDPVGDMRLYLDGFAQELSRVPCVIGVGRCDTHPSPGIDDYAQALEAFERVIPVHSVDVRQRTDVLLLIDSLLCQIEAGILEGEDE